MNTHAIERERTRARTTSLEYGMSEAEYALVS